MSNTNAVEACVKQGPKALVVIVLVNVTMSMLLVERFVTESHPFSEQSLI